MRGKAVRVVAVGVASVGAVLGSLVVGGALAGDAAGRELGDLNWGALHDAACSAFSQSTTAEARSYLADNCKPSSTTEVPRHP